MFRSIVCIIFFTVPILAQAQAPIPRNSSVEKSRNPKFTGFLIL